MMQTTKKAVLFDVTSLVGLVLWVACASIPVGNSRLESTPSSRVAETNYTTIIPVSTVVSPKMRMTSLSFHLENTQMQVSQGPGNIAWSHKGDWLAYVYGFSLYIVPDGRWNQANKVFRASIEEGPWDLDSLFLAWSPDDSSIGVTLLQYGTDSNNEHYTVRHMAQVDWRKGTLSLIAPKDEVSLTDWSPENRILAYRPDLPIGSEEILYVSTGVWQPILHPLTGKFGVGRPRWAPDGTLILGYYTDSKAEAAVICQMDPKSNHWQTLPVKMETYYGTGLPVPSPDRHWIAWIEGSFTADGVVSRIMLYDRRSGEIIKTADSKDNGTRGGWQALAWSPDSRRLAFSAGYDSDSQSIWILNLNLPR